MLYNLIVKSTECKLDFFHNTIVVILNEEISSVSDVKISWSILTGTSNLTEELIEYLMSSTIKPPRWVFNQKDKTIQIFPPLLINSEFTLDIEYYSISKDRDNNLNLLLDDTLIS